MTRALLLRLLICLSALAVGTAAFAQSGPGRNPDEAESAWRRLTPEQRLEAWKRLPPEQRQAIRQNATPEQRDAARQRWQERRDSGDAPGRRLSPEERRQLRDQVYESNRARPPRGGKNRR
jgi:hypothetical protein